MRLFVRLAALALFAWGLGPVPAIADPIQVVFNVHVVTRSLEPQGPTEGFEVRFPLTVGLDTNPRSLGEDCCSGFAQFEDAIVQSVPLENYGIPANVLPYDQHGVTGSWGRFEDGTYFRSLGIGIDLSYDPVSGGSSLNQFRSGIFGYEPVLTAQPSLDLLSLLGTVGGTRFENFFFVTTRERSNDQFDYLEYRGYATLADPSTPVPEPTSLLLFGTGLGILRLRIKRGRRDLTP